MNKTVKLLFYCTQAKPYLVEEYGFNGTNKQGVYYKCFPRKGIDFPILNGKIVAEAECELVEEIKFINDSQYGTNTLNQNDLLKESCIGMFDLYEYLFMKDGYAIHLKNVKPFEIPKELSDYYNKKPLSYDDWLYGIYSGGAGAKGNYESYLNVFKIKRASQNMMYAYDIDGNIYVLISIQSPYMCDIMNGKKTIEVRTSILNALKELIK